MRLWIGVAGIGAGVAVGLAGCGGSSLPTALTGTEPPAEPAAPLSREAIEAKLTQPVYRDIQRFEYLVEGGDGARIWVNVFRPVDADIPVPVILVKTPYQILNAIDADPTAGPDALNEPAYSPGLVNYYAPRGYAVAFADVRGNFNSGGCIEQSGPVQWQDTYNIVEHLAAEPWANGRVGMYGASYDGETQISGALLNPPSLKTIIPTASVSNQYEYSFYDGVAYGLGAIPTNAAYLAISLAPGTHPNALLNYPDRLGCMPENFINALDRSGDVTEFWEDRDYRPGSENIQTSVLHIHGLQDWNVKPNHIDGWFNRVTSEKRAIFGQWAHAFPTRPDWSFIVHRWFDHYLHGIDTGVLADLPPVLIQDTDGRWQGIEAFPPLDPEVLQLHLNADGSLAPEAGAAAQAVIRDVPQDIAGENLSELGELIGTISGTPDRLVFESAPLAAPLRIIGRPVLTLQVRTDARRTRWAVELQRVAADGRSSWINRGYLNTRHLQGLDRVHELTPGAPYTAAVRLFPQADALAVGERLRLVIRNVDGWVEQDTTFARSEIALGLEGSTLSLPLAPEGPAIEHERLRDGL